VAPRFLIDENLSPHLAHRVRAQIPSTTDRHCEERSDEAIQRAVWIASLRSQ
jgi:hypothetical protein